MTRDISDFRQSKHIYLGQTRIATKLGLEKHEETGYSRYEKVNTYYYSSDHLGSAQYITDFEGSRFSHYEYTPHGELWIEKSKDEFDMIPFRFTGKELDEETNLYYYGSRYFNPKTACWLSTDPAMEKYIPYAYTSDKAKDNENLPSGGFYNHFNLSPYNFNNNNPIKYIDPDGKMAQVAAGGGIAAIAAWIAAGAVLSILTCITLDKISDYAKERARENWPYELHHAFPMFLGGELKQNKVPLSRDRHKQLHRDLYVFLDKYDKGMKPGLGNSGRIIQSYYSIAETKEAMAKFYLVNMDQYADAAAQFFTDNPDLLNEDNLKWAKEHAFDSRFWQIVQSWLSEETPE